MLVQGENLRRYLEEALGYAMPEPATFIGKLSEDGLPTAVAGFAEWRLFDVEIYLWSAGRLTRDFLRRIEQYAFDELRVRWVRCSVAADATEWLDQLHRLGFQDEGRQRGGFDGDIDRLWLSITREEFRV